MKTSLLGLTLPKSIRKKCKGRSRTKLDTPADAAHCGNENTWTVLLFTEANWRSTYQVRAVASTSDVNPRVQEVLHLPVLGLAAAQDEDPDLVFMKELLRDHDVIPS